MSRAVLFDTETTGLDPLNGDRIIEFAGLELINDLPTGEYFHCLIDPERDVPAGAAESFGEMDPEAKHAISHRARAFAQLLRACFPVQGDC